MSRHVAAAGHDGWVEVEVMNAALWARPVDEFFDAVTACFARPQR